MPVVQFAPFSSQVEPGFWHALTQLKIDVLRLSADKVPITAHFNSPRTVIDKSTGQQVSIGGTITLSGNAFDSSKPTPPNAFPLQGVLKNFNTIEDFKNCDKPALLNELADEIWASNHLFRFLLLTFADLKKYKYYYWFAFPAFVAKPAWEIDEKGWSPAETKLTTAVLESIKRKATESSSFLVRITSSKEVEVGPITSYPGFFDQTPSESQYIVFVDPSPLPGNPGWLLRNLLTLLIRKVPTKTSFQVLCWRDVETGTSGSWRSIVGTVKLPSPIELPAEGQRWSVVGWEKDARGKLAPRLADLGSMMDPQRLAEQATELNLKLMRWRILPSLDLDKIATTKCLLLGAGTLGCYVARVLMGWGVKKITLLDSARVSFSNPVRQPLFEYEDCLDGGKEKAQCAADRLKKTWPGIDASGVTLSIPMPGHPIPPGETFEQKVKDDVQRLEELIKEHDVVYLLMDSRESRWLPTVIAASMGKIVINAALGFDSYLVMRHGPRAKTTKGSSRLGCYFCNDIVTPGDSLKDRTLDQMCTVTRPGLAPIASASAVELMVSLIQHPESLHAPAPPIPSPDFQLGDESSVPGSSILGIIPHQLRGRLAQFGTTPITGAAFDRCSGCSEFVLERYESEGYSFLVQAFNDSHFLEKVTGLDKLYAEGEEALKDIEELDEDDDF